MRSAAPATIAILAWALIFGAGCAVRHAPPLLPADIRRTPEESWAEVLGRYVNDSGQIQFAALARNPDPLHHYVAAIAATNAETAPRVFQNRESTLAHYINAYNALAMYNVIDSNVRPRDRFGFFILQHFNVGGRYTSLYDFENRVIRPLGDPRVHFALNCMVRSCPRLPREPFQSGSLQEQLEAAAREFLNDPRHVRVDHDETTVYVSRILKFYTGDFLDAAPTLISYVNRYRAKPIPKQYKIKFLPYDWTLNSAPEQPTPPRGLGPSTGVGRPGMTDNFSGALGNRQPRHPTDGYAPLSSSPTGGSRTATCTRGPPAATERSKQLQCECAAWRDRRPYVPISM